MLVKSVGIILNNWVSGSQLYYLVALCDLNDTVTIFKYIRYTVYVFTDGKLIVSHFISICN